MLVVVGVLFVALGLTKLVVARGIAPYHHTYGNRVVHYSLASALLNRRLDEVAIVPAGGGRRPLLVLLHGRREPGPLDRFLPHLTGPESMVSDQLLHALASLGRRAPVVVLLNGGDDSYFHDRRDGAWGSMILREAIPDARRRFDTTSRTGIGGVSMGGFGALHLAALDPSSFCAVGVRSAALWTSAAVTAPGAFDDAADYARTDVFAAARAGRYAHLPVWIDDGTQDPFRRADTTLAGLLEPGTAFHIWSGGHDNAYWRKHLAAYLQFFARNCS
jgi:enterochelin esterase-like enzyme